MTGKVCFSRAPNPTRVFSAHFLPGSSDGSLLTCHPCGEPTSQVTVQNETAVNPHSFYIFFFCLFE